MKIPPISVECPTCGSHFQTTQNRIAAGRGKFCSRACSAKVNSVRHGHAKDNSHTPTYNTWNAMVSRCTVPTHEKYPMYGALGISVCDRWRDFRLFLEDMGEKPTGTSIDRINGQLGYFKENCRWVSAKSQQRNLKNNVLISFAGKTQCLAAWSEETGIHHSTIEYRIKTKWPMDKVFTTPAKLGNRVKLK